jgi:hypothetical protein
MPSFTTGVESGKGVSNPFGIILREIGGAQKRRIEEDKTRKKEEESLVRALEILDRKQQDALELEEKKQEGAIELQKIKNTSGVGDIQAFIQALSGGSNIPPGTNLSVQGPGGSKVTLPLNRKFTGEEVKSLSTADQLTSEIGDLKSLIQSDKGVSAQFLGSLPFGAGTEQGQSFSLLKNSIGERLLRLRSGAQINEKEYQRFRKLLPSIFRKDKLDLKQLGRFEDEFNSIKGRILSGAKFDKDKSEFIVPEGGSAGTQGNVVIMTDSKGNRAKVRVDSNGKAVEVLEEL